MSSWIPASRTRQQWELKVFQLIERSLTKAKAA